MIERKGVIHWVGYLGRMGTNGLWVGEGSEIRSSVSDVSILSCLLVWMWYLDLSE